MKAFLCLALAALFLAFPHGAEAGDVPQISACAAEMRISKALVRSLADFWGARLEGNDAVLVGTRAEDDSVPADQQIKESVAFIRHSGRWHAYGMDGEYTKLSAYQDKVTGSIAIITLLESGGPSPTLTAFQLDTLSFKPTCTTLQSLSSAADGGRDYVYSTFDGFNMDRSGIATIALSGAKADNVPIKHFIYVSNNHGRTWGQLKQIQHPGPLKGVYAEGVASLATEPLVASLLGVIGGK